MRVAIVIKRYKYIANINNKSQEKTKKDLNKLYLMDKYFYIKIII